MNASSPPPEFIIIGAAKSGTTSLHAYLASHPEISMTRVKEARYLCYQGEFPDYLGYGKRGPLLMKLNRETSPSSLEGYQELFAHSAPGQLRGESSPAYLYEPKAAMRIQEFVPKAKLIAILRNPVERAFSAYLHMRREAAEPASFSEALRLETSRISEEAGLPWRYVDMGRYTHQLRRYLNYFPKEQLFFVLYDDLQRDPRGLCRKIFRFLNVNETHEPNIDALKNVSGEPRFRFGFPSGYFRNNTVRRMFHRLSPGRPFPFDTTIHNLLLTRPTIEVEDRQYLENIYREEIQKLSLLLDRDLSHWLT